MATTLTRRELAAALAGAGAVAPVMAQSQGKAAGDPVEAARQQIRESVEKLEEFELPASTAPAFVFKP